MENNEVVVRDVDKDLPVLSGDNILAVANEAEKRIEAVKKIKSLALRVVGNQDWVDENGKPYLQVSGAEKIARLFGINWRVGDSTLEFENDGHFRYIFKGEFTMGSVSIEAIGTRSSKDPFFSRASGQDIPADQIDKADVMKGAYTNCIGNGITRLLGIRNLSWEELGTAGFTKEKAGRVEFKTKAEATPEETTKITQIWDWLLTLAEGNETVARTYLADVTKFSSGGKDIPGVTDHTKLRGQRLNIAYGKIERLVKERK